MPKCRVKLSEQFYPVVYLCSPGVPQWVPPSLGGQLALGHLGQAGGVHSSQGVDNRKGVDNSQGGLQHSGEFDHSQGVVDNSQG